MTRSTPRLAFLKSSAARGRASPRFSPIFPPVMSRRRFALTAPMIANSKWCGRRPIFSASTMKSSILSTRRGSVRAQNLIVEPDARGTAVAIAYGAAVIKRRLGEGIIAAVAADHYIATAAQYRRTLADAIGLAAANESIVAVGITPTRPETGYGYQKIGPKVGAGFKIEKFVEKPALAIARRMVRSGRYLWNASMFVASTRTLAREFAAHCPALGKAADRLARTPRTKLARAYGRLRFDSFA